MKIYLNLHILHFSPECFRVLKPLSQEYQWQIFIPSDLSKQGQAIAGFKKYEAFNQLLDVGFDSNFPRILASCWKEKISEVGKKAHGVNLDRFLMCLLVPLPRVPWLLLQKLSHLFPVASYRAQPLFPVAATESFFGGED